MTNHLFYEVLHITEQEARLTARFRSLVDAKRYVRTHQAAGRWDIVLPDGRRLAGRDPQPSGSLRPGRSSPFDDLPEVTPPRRGVA